MPGPARRAHPGTPDDAPYVPSWCYRNGPKTCPCGHHEGYHDSGGRCLLRGECKCVGLPGECRTPDGQF